MKNRMLAVMALTLALTPALLTAQQKSASEGRRVGDFTLVTEVPTTKVLSQGNTGTCWSFGTMSFLESEVARTSGKPVDLSEMYVVRQCILEKARRWVKTGGKQRFGQGGLSHDVSTVINKYGLLPAEAYTGLCKGQRMHSHGELFKFVKGVTEKLVNPKARRQRRLSGRWEAALMAAVDVYLGGTPPQTVDTPMGKLTPKEYSEKVLKLKGDDYVEVMSYGYAPFHQKAKLTVPDNWMQYDKYLNLPVDEFMAGFDHALQTGYSIAVDMDVSEPGFSPRSGVARLPAEQEKPGAITQAVRDEMFKTKKTTDDHLMHVIGMARDDDGGKYYYTKNSWGAQGKYKGYLFISEAFMRAKLLAFMVHKDALPQEKSTND